jgi:hypothetical protein
MAETEPDQPSSSQKSRYSDYAKYITFERVISTLDLLVLSVTMAAVFWYAGEARKQNILIGAEGRPVVYEYGVNASERTPDGIPSKAKIRFQNFGKSLAISIALYGHIVLKDAGDPAPTEPRCNEAAQLAKDVGGTAIAPDSFVEPEWIPLAGEDLTDVYRGKILYVVGCAYYLGLDRTKTYYSDLCVVWTPKAPQDFRSCSDPHRNNAD